MEAGKFRSGTTFKMDNAFWRVVEAQNIQQPRMAAFVRARIKNIETGAVQEKRFNVGDYFDDVELTKKEVQFSYQEGEIFYFMDNETFDLIPVNRDLAEEPLKYHTDGTNYSFEYCDEKIVNIAPPTFVVLTVLETEPSVAGDTARNALKNAKLDSGISVKVPMFINNGDKVRVDTRTGTYAERA